MCRVYRYRGNFPKGDEGFSMIKKCAENYASETGCFHNPETEVEREDGGKPFFTDSDVHFSLTHTGDLWMCAFSDRRCGLDAQVMEDKDYIAISGRFFSKQENEYVKEKGRSGFYDIWTRKEAFCKWTGKGFFSEMPSMVNEDGSLIQDGVFRGNTFYFTDIIDDAARCVLCTEEKNKPEVVTVEEFLW